MQEFLEAPLRTERALRLLLRKNVPVQMEDEDWKAFHKATECHIRQKSPFKVQHQRRDRVLAP